MIKDIGNRCCACRACEQVCMFDAIKFDKDQYGYEYPVVDFEKCVECGKCGSVCPILNHSKGVDKPLVSCAATAVDDTDKYNGSSGGLFGTFAKRVIDNGGIVFGAAFDSEMELKTSKAETEHELIPLYKSKYLICNTYGAFEKIREYLYNGREVLYCSTPCQVSALNLFLGKKYENLITVEFVCHGVGNQHMFNESLKSYGKEKNSTVTNFSFRHKKKDGASSHCYKINLENGKVISGLYFDFPYYNAYCKELAYRDSCYICPYASRNRNSDITIGDFHNIEKYYPEIDRLKGISMLLCNTDKGLKLLEKVKGNLKIWEMSTEILYENNRFANTETSTPEEAKLFREAFKRYGYDRKTKKILNTKLDILKKVYYHMPNFIKKSVKALRR